MTKEPEYHVGCGLFGVYAGTLMKPKKDGMIMWRKKSDVTEEAIHAVMQYFKQMMEILLLLYMSQVKLFFREKMQI